MKSMFEQYSLKKYQSSTGVIQWMLNSPWPRFVYYSFKKDCIMCISFFVVVQFGICMIIFSNQHRVISQRKLQIDCFM
jgi:hypothetical protein